MGSLASRFRPLRRGGSLGFRLWIVATFIAGLVFTVTPAAPTRAANLTVTNTNDSGPGSLRQAVQTANSELGTDTITFDTAQMGGTTINLTSGELLITSNITFDGPTNVRVALSGTVTSRVLRIDGGTVNLNHLTLTQGKALVTPNDTAGRGGGLFISGGTVRLDDVTVTQNDASAGPVSGSGGLGGGAYIVGGDVTIVNSTFSDNNAIRGVSGGRGGGIYIDGGNVALTNVTVIGNTAEGGTNNAGGFGGGIYVANGTTTTTNLLVAGNRALGLGIGSGSGGGLYISGGTITLGTSRVINNLASDDPAPGAALGTTGASGGGIYLAAGTLNLEESRVSGNTAEGGQFGAQGGGVVNVGGTANVLRSTISGNTAGGGRTSEGASGASGGGLFVAGGTTLVSASIVGTNEAIGGGNGSGSGGGIFVAATGGATLENSTVYQNAAKGGAQTNGLGGGVYVAGGADENNPSIIYRGKAILRNMTVHQNVAAGTTGGVGRGSNFYFDEYGEATLTNTIVAGTGAVASCALTAATITNITNGGNNLDEDGSCQLAGQGSITGQSPQLQEVEAGGDSPTLYLLPQVGSPARNAGNNATCTTTDQRGILRPQGGTCDIGSIEVVVLNFGDVAPGDLAATAIAELAARGIINGCDAAASPPLFCPNEGTLRSQMAALIVRAMPGWSEETFNNTFTDKGVVDDELWRRVATLQHYSVVGGYNDCAAQGKVAPCYGPVDPVLKAQAISFVTRAMVAKGYWVQQPTDTGLYGGVLVGTGHEQDATTYWHYTRAWGGVPDHPEGGSFPVNQEATRAWFARLLWTALETIP